MSVVIDVVRVGYSTNPPSQHTLQMETALCTMQIYRPYWRHKAKDSYLGRLMNEAEKKVEL